MLPLFLFNDGATNGDSCYCLQFYSTLTIDGSAFSLTFYHTKLQEIKTFGLGFTTGDGFFRFAAI